MGDPVSITTGVLALLGTWLKVGWQLKQLYDGAAIANTKVQSLLTDVEGYTRVLQSMKETFQQDKVKSTLEATGHIGSHWSNLSASIRDGQESLSQLEATLDKVNKNVSLLDGARKHIRLMVAADEIVMYQLQIRSHRDTLQLSLQTVMLNQPGHEMESLKHLRNTIQLAATVVSSTSTIMGVDLDQEGSSDFGDCFPREPNEAMNKWLSSNTVYEFGEGDENEQQYGNSGGTSQPANNLDGSDSDSELDAELSQALFKRGVEKLTREDLEGAESLLRKSLARAPGSDLESRRQILTSIHVACRGQNNYNECRAVLLEILSFHPNNTHTANIEGIPELGGPDGDARIKKSLRLLIMVCQDEGNHVEEEAFTAILSDFRAKMVADPSALVEETQASPKPTSLLAPAVSQLASGDPERPAQYQQSYIIHGKTYPSRVTSVEDDQRLPYRRKSFDKQFPTPIGNNEQLSTTDAIDEALPVPNDVPQSFPLSVLNPSTINSNSDSLIIILGDESCGKTEFLMFAESGKVSAV
ncbi:hypothetical protein BKA61DRAFT_718097 [Leptodontidium sp. MPI-SDFR-AT-0119]|nr:hypothetical protein BKA61DRAFT_718097 [Leptodontidium sp. MPI-SDFR-AT-0119]